jgi:hypothetical protein
MTVNGSASAPYDGPWWVALRWVAVIPASIVIAIIAYVLTSIVNGLVGSELVSGLASLLAAGAAGYISVAMSLAIAPEAKRAAATAVAAMMILASFFVIGNVVTGQAPKSEMPSWYLVIVWLAFAVGAICGLFAEASFETVASINLPPLVRWILFLPVAVVVGAGVMLAMILGVVQFFPGASGILDIETRFIPAIILISLAIAIAPSHRRIVAVAVSLLWIVGGSGYLVGAISRPIVQPLIEHAEHGPIVFDAPAWLMALRGAAWFLAGVIPLVYTFQMTRKRVEQ